MPDIVLEQALYLRAAGQAPRLRARSPGFADGWLADVARILHDFGERPGGVRCPHAVFAQPMVQDWVAVVQVADQAGEHQDPALGFHVVVVPRKEYGELLGEPFALADRFAPPWSHAGGELPALALPGEPVPPRTVADVQQVLKRVKAAG